VTGRARLVVVYYPYYEPFIRWARRVLTTGATTRYRRAAGLPPDHAPRWEQLDLAFVRQHGRYAHVTSILNAPPVTWGNATAPTGCGSWKAAPGLLPRSSRISTGCGYRKIPSPNSPLRCAAIATTAQSQSSRRPHR